MELLVPLSYAIEWEMWLTDALSEEAHTAHAGYDGGEEEARYESHLFTDTDTATVKAIAERALACRGLRGSVAVTGQDTVTVSLDASAHEWIVCQPLPGAYGRAVRELCEQLNGYEQMRLWLVSHGYRFVTVRQAPGGRRRKALFQTAPADGSPDELFMIAPVDLSIYEQGATASESPRLLARQNMRSILVRLTAHLGSPLPEALPELEPLGRSNRRLHNG